MSAEWIMIHKVLAKLFESKEKQPDLISNMSFSYMMLVVEMDISNIPVPF